MISDLIKEAFLIAVKDHGITNKKTPIAKFISNWVSLNRKPTTMSYKTISSHYDTCFDGNELNEADNETKISIEYLNAYAAFVGCEDYHEYVLKNGSNIDDTHENEFVVDPFVVEEVSSKKIGLILTVVLFIAVVTVLILKYAQENNQDKCMVWKHTRYQIVNCEESKDIANSISLSGANWEKKYKDFKRIKLTNTTSLYDQNGNTLVWYTKINDGFEFFNNPGSHPISGKTLRPVNQSIRNFHLNPNNSEMTKPETVSISDFSESDQFLSEELQTTDSEVVEAKGKYCFKNNSTGLIKINISSPKGVISGIQLVSQEQMCIPFVVGNYQYNAFIDNSKNPYKVGKYTVYEGAEGYLELKGKSEKVTSFDQSEKTKSVTQPPVKECTTGDFKIINNSINILTVAISKRSNSPLSHRIQTITVKPNKTGNVFDLMPGSYNVTVTHQTHYVTQEFLNIRIKACDVAIETIE